MLAHSYSGRDAKQPLQRSGWLLDVVIVRDRDYAHAFAAIAALRPSVQALVVSTDPAFLRDRREIIEMPTQHRLPAVYRSLAR